MPNWSSNRITMYENYELDSRDFYKNKEGKHAITDIYEKFLKDITVERKEGEDYYNLMEIMPTPEILEMVHASSPPYLIRDRETGEFLKQSIDTPELGEEREAFYKTNTHPKFEKVEIVEGTDIYNELWEKYGCLSWYDWNVKNWGTKWEITLEKSEISFDEYNLQFWCDSAWCPPEGLLQHIADKYNVNVECFYEIEGYGNDGVGKDTYEPASALEVEV